MLKAIVGIEINILRIEGKAKLSQNREDRDRLNAATMLATKGDDELSEAMRKVQ
jgi:transcriptional regulator